MARVLEGQVPGWKLFGARGSAGGIGDKSFGLPRFERATFKARFPFGTVSLADPEVPLTVDVTGWSPFTPGDADSSSLPVAALKYHFTNPTAGIGDAVFSFNAKNFMPVDKKALRAVRATLGGFVLWGGGAPEAAWEEGAFAAMVSDPEVKVDHAWFRGGWFDPLTMAWNTIATGACLERPPVEGGDPSPGATLFVPFQLAARTSRTISLRLCWHVGRTNLRSGTKENPVSSKVGTDNVQDTYQPWYAGRFPDVEAIAKYWSQHYDDLRSRSKQFADTFHATTLPSEVVEAVAANLTILKSPTIFPQTDGRLWAWEGCNDDSGC